MLGRPPLVDHVLAAWMARAVLASIRVTRLDALLMRHRIWLRAAWLIAALVLAACQPDSNGGGGPPGGDGY